MNQSELASYKQAVKLAQSGDKSGAYPILKQLSQSEDGATNPDLWLWLVFTAPELAESEAALAKVIALNPAHSSLPAAKDWLAKELANQEWLKNTRSYNQFANKPLAASSFVSTPRNFTDEPIITNPENNLVPPPNLPMQAPPYVPAPASNGYFYNTPPAAPNTYSASYQSEEAYSYIPPPTLPLSPLYSPVATPVKGNKAGNGWLVGVLALLGVLTIGIMAIIILGLTGVISGGEEPLPGPAYSEAEACCDGSHPIGPLQPHLVSPLSVSNMTKDNWWGMQFISDQDGRSLRAVKCINATTCYLGGDGGLYLATYDAGKSWQTLPLEYDMKSISCPTTTSCRIIAKDYQFRNNGFIHTDNAGKNWFQEMYQNVPEVNGTLSCPDVNTCFAITGDKIWCAKFILSASAMAACPLGASGYDMKSIFCEKANFCIAVGAYGTIIALNVGPEDKTWYDRSTPTNQTLRGLDCSKTRHCAAVGDSGAIAYSSDGGDTWQGKAASGVRQRLNAVSCPNGQTCYGVGEQGTVVATHDGGTSWQSQISGTTKAFYAISCYGTKLCMAVGEKGTIFINQKPG